MNQVRICFSGAWLSMNDAEDYRQGFFDQFEQDINDGLLVLIQDDITMINGHYVVRIMAENAQGELFDEDN